MSSFADTLKSMGPARLGVMGVVLIGLIVFFIVVSLQVSKPSMTLLYSDLGTLDSSSIAAKLEESQIPYQIAPDGAKVFVPRNEVGRARLLLAEAGLPNGGSLGYELFDQQSGFGTTTFVQNINQRRALEGELSRTIISIDAVQQAKVHIVLPTRELFSREARQPSASVTIKLNPAARLGKNQVFAIQNLVASAIPELQPNQVSVIDTEANLLAGGNEAEGPAADDARLAFETRMKNNIEDIIGRIVGLNRVRASVSADLNFDRISTNSESFDPDTVVRSTQIVSESEVERGPPGQSDVTVNNNLPGLDAVGEFPDGASSSELNRTEEVTNFEINRTVQTIVRESGSVEKLSVAVLVDGTYNTNEEGVRTYEPRSEEELEKIRTLVASAIGFDASRGDSLEVINLEFAPVEISEFVDDSQLFGFEKGALLETAQMIMLAIMMLLVIILVIKPIVTQLIAVRPESSGGGQDEVSADGLIAAQQQAALAPPPSIDSAGGLEAERPEEALIDMQQVEGKVKASTVKKVGDIVETHPSETVSVIRNWMSQES